MIIANMTGGLGNQMFQYAAARHLALRLGTPLKLDISGFETYKLHRYSLNALDIQAEIASAEEKKAMGIRRAGVVERYVRYALRCPAKPGPKHIMEKEDYIFDPGFLALPDGIYLDGYWQSEKYFVDIADTIRREFTVKSEQAGDDLKAAGEILSCESVSLHIRRADYLSDPVANATLGICGLDYYARAIAHVADRVENARLFVFSDDPEWTRANLVSKCPVTFVSHNGPDRNYEDQRLMSQCRHHIIANSSFSWWGAWLNPSPSKIVITPTVWVRKAGLRTDDLVPGGWIRM